MSRRRNSPSPHRRRSPSYGRKNSYHKQKSPYKWKYVHHPFHPHHDGLVLYKKKKVYSPKRRGSPHYKKTTYYKPKGYLPYYLDNPPDARTAAELLKAINLINGNTDPHILLLSSTNNPIVTNVPIPTTANFPQNAVNPNPRTIYVYRQNAQNAPLLQTTQYLPGIKMEGLNTSTPTFAPNKLYLYLYEQNQDTAIIQKLKTEAANRFLIIQAVPVIGLPYPNVQSSDPELNGKFFPLYYNQNTKQWLSPSESSFNRLAFEAIKNLSTAALV